MQTINRLFWNKRQPSEAPAGVLMLPLERPYFAALMHVTYRNRSQPQRDARTTHAHDVYHIVLVNKGRGTFVMGTDLVPAEPGQIFITSPGEWHSFGCEEGVHLEYCEVTFEFRDQTGRVLVRPFHEVLAAWTGKTCQPLTTAAAPADLHLLIMQETERMVRMGFARERDYPLYLNASLARIMLALYTQLYRERPVAVANPLTAVREYVHQHCHEALNLDELAALADLTPNYVSRRFKKEFGATPLVYQHRLRVQAAADLLGTTQYPIKHIAEIVGYSDVYFFSRMFRKIQGLPPGQHRKLSYLRAPRPKPNSPIAKSSPKS